MRIALNKRGRVGRGATRPVAIPNTSGFLSTGVFHVHHIDHQTTLKSLAFFLYFCSCVTVLTHSIVPLLQLSPQRLMLLG